MDKLKAFDPVIIAQELVRIPSESSSPSGNYPGIKGEAEAVLYISHLLDSADIEHELIEVLPGRPNLYAYLPAPGKPKLILDNHLDTVSGKNMEFPSFDGFIKDNKLWGRGACDVKGAAGALIATLCNIATQNIEQAYDICAVFTVDEESSFAGASHASKYLNQADLILVLEPTEFDLVISHKGVLRLKVTTTGKAAHGSTPQKGENAIYKMSRVIQQLQEYSHQIETHHSSLLGKATLSINRIMGGVAFNTIPDTCSIDVDIRLLPEMNQNKIIEEIRDRLGSDVHIDIVLSSKGLENLSAGNIRESFIKCHQDIGINPEMKGVAFGTDSSYMNILGPCLVWGPGDIKYAHTSQENIQISDIDKASDILWRFFLTPP